MPFESVGHMPLKKVVSSVCRSVTPMLSRKSQYTDASTLRSGGQEIFPRNLFQGGGDLKRIHVQSSEEILSDCSSSKNGVFGLSAVKLE